MRVLQIANYREGVGGISGQVSILKENLSKEGVSCDILSTKGSIGKRLCVFVRLLFIGHNYDVFHIHACSRWGFLPAVFGITAGRILKRRIVLTYHGGGADSFLRKHKQLALFFLSRTTANIALSDFVGAIFDKYGIDYVIIPNIIELDERRFRKRSTIQPHFVSIRTLAEIYNIECTLRAFAQVKNKFLDAKLLVLGDGPLRLQLESFVLEKEIRDVTFVGHVNNEDIYDYLDKADIMISSSRVDNMPVSILEGMNAGLLVIASRVGGVPYMIDDRETGLLFDSNDDSLLAERMIWGVTNQTESIQIINKAKQNLAKYSWKEIRKAIMRVYGNE